MFDALISNRFGYFSFDAFTARKRLFSNVAFFNEELQTSQDRDLMLKIAAKGRLLPGNIKEPVAVRRVHSNNRITQLLVNREKAYHSSVLMWNSLYEWGILNLDKHSQLEVAAHYMKSYKKADYLTKSSKNSNYFYTRKKMLEIARENPALFLKLDAWKSLLPATIIIKKYLI